MSDPPMPPPVPGKRLLRRTPEEIREFAIGLAAGTAYLPRTEAATEAAFQTLLVFGAGEILMEYEDRDEIVLWEWLKEAGPLSINGYPSFFSMQVWHNEDVKAAFDQAREIAGVKTT